MLGPSAGLTGGSTWLGGWDGLAGWLVRVAWPVGWPVGWGSGGSPVFLFKRGFSVAARCPLGGLGCCPAAGPVGMAWGKGSAAGAAARCGWLRSGEEPGPQQNPWARDAEY